MSRPPLSVLVVDDHTVFAEALSSALRERSGAGHVEVVGSVPEAISALRRTAPDVVVLDVRVGPDDGLCILDVIGDVTPTPRVVVLTGHPRPDVHRRAAEHGATVLFKGAGLAELVAAVQGAIEGAAEGAPVEARVTAPGTSELEWALTTREAQVLQLLAVGLDVTQVARRLGLSAHTVRDHVRSARTKFEVPSQLAAVMEAIRRGEIEFPT